LSANSDFDCFSITIYREAFMTGNIGQVQFLD